MKEERKERIDEFKEKVKDTAAEIKTSAKERMIGKIRSKIEKHQKKITDLEKQLQAVVEKNKEAVQGQRRRKREFYLGIFKHLVTPRFQGPGINVDCNGHSGEYIGGVSF